MRAAVAFGGGALATLVSLVGGLEGNNIKDVSHNNNIIYLMIIISKMSRQYG